MALTSSHTLILHLDQKELDDLKPYVNKAVMRFVGLSEPSVVSAALSLLGAGADKSQFTSKMRSLHPSLLDNAHKLTDTIFEIASEYAHSLQELQNKSAKKRSSLGLDSSGDGVSSGGTGLKASKLSKTEDEIDADAVLNTPSPGQLTALQIQQMMADAKRMINVRKQALEATGITLPPSMMVGVGAHPPGVIVPTPIVRNIQMEANNNAIAFDDKKKKLAELQAQIASKLASGGFKPDEEPTKPIPLLLDNEGRAIDVSGKQLLFPTRQPTLKANIRAQKRTDIKPVGKDGNKGSVLEEDEFMPPGGNKYFDERLAPLSVVKKGLERKRKALRFNDPGKYVAIAQKQRTEARLNNLKSEIADKARKTGIANATRMAKLSGTAGVSDKSAEYIPQVEWWDTLILEEVSKKSSQDLITYDSPLKLDAITNLIEHPTQMRCPTDPSEPHLTQVYLTKKEQKKLRRQNRRETWKEKQEKIRLGLEPPPPPKVRISNLMRVLGTEAVQDPTKVEAHVRQQMAKRQKTHQDTNAARKLTPEQKKAKKIKKMQEDVSLGVSVSVYRIDCLGSQAKRFKVETVAHQLHLTGVVVMYRECNIVVVEGGPKQQSKYRRLIMSRIKWDEDMVRDKEDTPNKCILVWEGMVKERGFPDFKYKPMKTEEMVREFFRKYGVQHYWDAALSQQCLEALMADD